MNEQQLLQAANCTRRFRKRNQQQGLCPCGRERSLRIVRGGRRSKLCDICGKRSEFQRLVRDNPGATIIEKPVAIAEIPRRTWIQLVSEHDPAFLAEWAAFCLEYRIPQTDALESAMELLMSVTRQAEPRQEDPIFESETLQLAEVS